MAARVDGHPENAAASVVGGLVAATLVRGAVRAVRLPLDAGLVFVAMVPDRPLPTTKARQALPQRGEPDRRHLQPGPAGAAPRRAGRPLPADPGGDRGPAAPGLPQPAVPRGPPAAGPPGRAGALASCWSGAGPTLLGICDGERRRARCAAEAPRQAMEEVGRAPGRALLLRTPTSRALIVDGVAPAVTRTFHIRTFGCQMNEHDSERLAGLLIADGLEPTDDVEDADVVVLNTCCIRENADNKLYGHLGLAQVAARQPARACRSPWAAAWPRRTASIVRSARRPRRRGVRHPQPGPCPGAAAPGGRRGPGGGDPRRARSRGRVGAPAGAVGRARAPVRGVGHHPDGVRQLVRLLHRAPGARARGQPALSTTSWREVDGPGRPRGDRGHAARAERQLLRARPHPAPPAVRRAAAGGGRRRRHPAGALHEPAPEGPPARDDRGHGRDAGGVRAPPPAPAVGERPGARAPCAAATRAERYLERLAAARAAIPDLAVTTDIIVGFPGETDDDFERTLEVAAEAEYDSAYTFIFSPRPGPGRPP